jgi:N6-adenosine-specific RNA methylase IME4
MTRHLLGERAMTPAEKQQRYRDLRNPKSTLFKQLKRNAREAELGAQIWALPTRRAGILYLDPPIDWEPHSRITGMDRHAANHYPVLAFAAFSETVPELPAAKDAIAFMWSFRDRRLEMAQQFLKDRGFERKTMHAWHKTIGTGYILRDNCELLLIASRGDPVWPAFGQQAWAAIKAPAEPWEGLFDGIIEAAKPYRRHSQKPEIFADHISRLWPNTPKLEMYYRAFPDPDAERARRAKREAAGWYFYGNEADHPETLERSTAPAA